MMDYTLSTYRQLLNIMLSQGYKFLTFRDFLQNSVPKLIVLRHDVDKQPENALTIARLELELETKASFYFRAVEESFDERIMQEIEKLGHEIGYHYEDLSLAKGDPRLAIQHFKRQLSRFRRIYPVQTICMHGSPLSRYDNRDIWKHYDYRDYGIIGEPYFDVDYRRVFYVTDTGRRWNQASTSVRDKVESPFDIPIRSTFHFVELIESGQLPDQMIINVHPQRWHDKPFPWLKELVGQRVKNVIKYWVVKRAGYR